MQGPSWWVSGKEGSLSPWSKAQVWALHTISEKRGLKITNEEITSLVWKVGSEGEEDGHPTNAAISQLRSVFAADPQWHPGKHEENAKKRGPKVKFDARKRLAVARAAMALKRTGVEPTASQVIARCPAATTNPSTGEAFDEKLILEVFRTKCYDLSPDCPWRRLQPVAKTALPDWLEAQRYTWGKELETWTPIMMDGTIGM